MRSYLDQLDDESILLMYLAEELLPADRAAVERRLVSDGRLREELESLRLAQEQIVRSLDSLDRAQALPATSASARRSISRMLKQWHVDRLLGARRAKLVPAHRSKWIWALPFAAAAMLLVGIGIWWGIQPDRLAPIATLTDLPDSQAPDDSAIGPTSAPAAIVITQAPVSAPTIDEVAAADDPAGATEAVQANILVMEEIGELQRLAQAEEDLDDVNNLRALMP